MHWGKWYKGVYDMLPSDRPNDEIINDDVRLDKWLAAFMREMARKHAQQRNGGGGRQPAEDFSGAIGSAGPEALILE